MAFIRLVKKSRSLRRINGTRPLKVVKTYTEPLPEQLRLADRKASLKRWWKEKFIPGGFCIGEMTIQPAEVRQRFHHVIRQLYWQTGRQLTKGRY